MCFETACPASALGVWGCPVLATPVLLKLQPDVLAFGERSLEPQFADQCISRVSAFVIGAQTFLEDFTFRC